MTTRNIFRLFNSLQLLAYFPLLNLQFPPDVLVFFSYIVEFVNFKLLPSSYVMSILIPEGSPLWIPYNA